MQTTLGLRQLFVIIDKFPIANGGHTFNLQFNDRFEFNNTTGIFGGSPAFVAVIPRAARSLRFARTVDGYHSSTCYGLGF